MTLLRQSETISGFDWRNLQKMTDRLSRLSSLQWIEEILAHRKNIPTCIPTLCRLPTYYLPLRTPLRRDSFEETSHWALSQLWSIWRQLPGSMQLIMLQRRGQNATRIGEKRKQAVSVAKMKWSWFSRFQIPRISSKTLSHCSPANRPSWLSPGLKTFRLVFVCAPQSAVPGSGWADCAAGCTSSAEVLEPHVCRHQPLLLKLVLHCPSWGF